MDAFPFMLALIVVLALAFDFINGFHDAANAIATVVSTRVLSPRSAVIFGAVFNLLGALLGTEVAATIGKGLVEAKAVSMELVLFALIGAIVWNLITWRLGLPTSSSHALIGSLMGAVCFSLPDWRGLNLVYWSKVLEKVIYPMFLAPVVGITVGFIVMALLTWVVYRVSVHNINRVFGKLQIVSAGVMALSHGHNDAQKSMGIIALALVTYYPSQQFEVPLWVILSCALAMGAGTLNGGWRIIRTLGSKMIKLQPIHGFAAETTAAGIIMSASHFGLPLSTTHVISSAIMGVGATKRLSAVRWGVVGNIVWAWVLTIPLTFLFSGFLTTLFLHIKQWAHG
ncbi:MAG: inorganic phosphate transporter [Vampirovibrionales bacterium]|nr:inorganic phosphate transporter [Vampirovibrionales bacterium]